MDLIDLCFVGRLIVAATYRVFLVHRLQAFLPHAVDSVMFVFSSNTFDFILRVFTLGSHSFAGEAIVCCAGTP